MCLRLGNIGSCLFGEAKLEMCAFEVKHPLLTHGLFGGVFMGELCLVLRVELALIASQRNIGAV
jgi:hypothetical protein